MQMLSSCPQTSTWLYRSFLGLIQPVQHMRFVSTTSAINRGLRATRNATESTRNRRDESRQQRLRGRNGDQRSNGGRVRSRKDLSQGDTVKPTRIKKFTSQSGPDWTDARPAGSYAGGRKESARTTQDREGSARGQRRMSDDRRDDTHGRSEGRSSGRQRDRDVEVGKRTRTTTGRAVQKRQADARVAQSVNGIRQDRVAVRSERMDSGKGREPETQRWKRNEASIGGARRGEHSPAKFTHEVSKSPKQQDRLFTLASANSTRTSTEKQPLSRPKENDDQSLSTPYTTSSSTFLYGTNTVLAALKAHRRKIYKLHTNNPSSYDKTTAEILHLAQKHKIPTNHNASPQLLDKLSQQRPHNNFVLETSMLPAPPVLSLGAPSETGHTLLELAHQTKEDIATNGKPTHIPTFRTTTTTQTPHHPLILMLDGILNPGNLGTLLRSAHFFGITAVAIATATCANLNSPVVAKASSGACEAIALLALPKPANFVAESKKAGWKIWAAVAPSTSTSSQSQRTKGNVKYITTSQLAQGTAASARQGPCILMLGAEGEGLRANLLSKADYFVSIEGGGKEGVDVGVDSLNVSVAGGVLMDAVMRELKAPRLSKGERRLVTGNAERNATEEEEQEVSTVEGWKDGDVKIEV